MVIDFTIPVNNNLILERNEKLDNYAELQLKLARIHD